MTSKPKVCEQDELEQFVTDESKVFSQCYTFVTIRKSKNRVRIRTEKAGKYGRWLAEVYYKSDAEGEGESEAGSNVESEGKEKEEEKCLNKELIERGFAREYDGGER